LPLEQYCVVSHSMLAQGSSMQAGGEPAQIWPMGQPKVRQVSSTQAPFWQRKPLGQLMLAQGSVHTAMPVESTMQLLPAGQLALAQASGTHRFDALSQTKPPGQGNSPVPHWVRQLPWKQTEPGGQSMLGL